MIPGHGQVLGLACGSGRNALYLAGLGYRVTAVDRDLDLSAPVPCRRQQLAALKP